MSEPPNQAEKEGKEMFHLQEANERMYNDNCEFPISSNNNIQISFNQLLKYSRIVQQEFPKNEIIERLSNQLHHLQSTCNIKEENISTFFKLLKDEQIEVSYDQFCDLYRLSEIFKVDSLQKLLQRYLDNHCHNIDLIIKIIIDQISSENSELYALNIFSADMEKYLNNNIDKCIENQNFGKLPVSMIFRIFEKSDIQKISSDTLYDFISKHISERYTLLAFLNIKNLSDEKFNDMYSNFSNLDESDLIQYYDYLRIDLGYIKMIKDDAQKSQNQIDMLIEKNEQLQKEQYQSKTQNNQMQKQIDELETLKNQLQEQISNLKKENNEMKAENHQIKEDNKQLKIQIDKLNNEIQTQKQQAELEKKQLQDQIDQLKKDKNSQPQIPIKQSREDDSEKNQSIEQDKKLDNENAQLKLQLEEYKRIDSLNKEKEKHKYFEIIKELISNESDIEKICISDVCLTFLEQFYIMHVKREMLNLLNILFH